MKTIQNDFGIIESITRINAEINRLYAAKELQLKALSTIYPPVDEEATPAAEKKKRGRTMGTEDLEKRQKSAVK